MIDSRFRVSCLYLTLAEIPTECSVLPYHNFVRPLDYDFSLVRNADYQVVGILNREGSPWLYIAPIEGDITLDVMPAVLFSFEQAVIPSDIEMIVRLTGASRLDFEILPKKISKIDFWFERYIDGDKDVVTIVESEIKRLYRT